MPRVHHAGGVEAQVVAGHVVAGVVGVVGGQVVAGLVKTVVGAGVSKMLAIIGAGVGSSSVKKLDGRMGSGGHF